MPVKLLIGHGSVIASGEDTADADPAKIVQGVKKYDQELEKIVEYTSFIAAERGLLVLDLIENDPNEDDRNARIAEMLGAPYTAKAVASSARRGREARRTRSME